MPYECVDTMVLLLFSLEEEHSRQKGPYLAFSITLHPFTSVVKEPLLTDWFSEQKKWCIDSVAKKAFSILIPFKQPPLHF